MPDQPHPGGRPTDYDPAYCAKVIEWGKQGKSKTWMAAQLDCTRQTIHNWMAANPEFLDAITRAMAHSQAWWEDKGQGGLDQSGFNSSVWSRSMGARFPDEWREVKGSELTGKDGGPISVKAQPAEWTIVDPAPSGGA